MNKISNLLKPPIFEDEQKNRIAYMLRIILLTMLVALFLVMIVAWLSDYTLTLYLMVIDIGLLLVTIWFMRRGYLMRASLIFLLSLAAILTFLAYSNDGIHDIAIVAYPALIVVASLLLNRRWFVIFVGLVILSITLIAFSEINGVISTPFSKQAVLSDALIAAIVLIVTAIALRLLTENLFDSLTRTRRNELALTKANAELQREITQRRRAERTLRQAEILLRRRNQELTLLNQVGQELNAALDTVQVNERLLQAMVETIGTKGAAIWLRESNISGPDENSRPSPESGGEPGEELPGLICRAVFRSDRNRSLINQRLQYGQGLAGWAAKTGESVMLDNVAQDPRFFVGIDALSGFQTRSLLTVPLKVHNQVLGVLQVVNKLEGNFSSADLIFAETLAASAAIALQNAQLVAVLRQRSQQLERQNEELDAYAHTVAHDLKTPIARMVGFAEYLEQSHADMPDQERGQYLQLVAKNGRKMIDIIDELLLLAGVRQAKKVKFSAVEMKTVVQSVQERLAGLIETAQAQIITPNTWPTAVGYAPWLEEVWANYINNAIKYGGQPPRIELDAEPLPTGQLRFWVRDNGPGLKPEEMEHLFTPFTRLEQSNGKGHGLGLSIVRRIAEKLGGQVGVESQGIPGQGCAFWFTLNPPPAAGNND